MSGLLPDAEVTLASFSLLQQLMTLCFMVPLSFSFATATRVGNQIGEGNPWGARVSFSVALCAQVVTSAAIVSTLLFSPLRYQWSRLFTNNDPGVDKLCADTMPYLAVATIFDGMNQVLSGAIRGTGQQLFGSINGESCTHSFLSTGSNHTLTRASIAVGLSYAIALPLAAALAFEWRQSWLPGLKGLYVGLVAGCFLQATLNAILVCANDWGAIARRAQENIMSTSIHNGSDVGLGLSFNRSLTFQSTAPIVTNLARSSHSHDGSDPPSVPKNSVPYDLILSQVSNVAGGMAIGSCPASRANAIEDEWRRVATDNHIERMSRSQAFSDAEDH